MNTAVARLQNKLERELGRTILDALKDDDVIEVMLNEDGVLWLEYFSKGMVAIDRMTHSNAAALLNTIATNLDTVINQTNPVLEGSLPLDGSRVAGTIPPITSAPTFAIRKKPKKIFTLDEYVQQGVMTLKQQDAIKNIVKEHKNILVAGGTSSGKTTLSNAIIHEITQQCPEERLIIIEDTPEIQCAVKNHNRFLTSTEISAQRLLRLTLRYRPDRILFGEVRGGEALELLKAWNTGHPGGVSTLHANSANAGLLRMERCIGEATPSDMRSLIGEAVNAVVNIAKTSQGRRIREIIEVKGFDGNDYITSSI